MIKLVRRPQKGLLQNLRFATVPFCTIQQGAASRTCPRMDTQEKLKHS